MIVGTRTSTRVPVAGNLRPGERRASSAAKGWWGTNASGRSSAPTRRGTLASAAADPGPHASARTSSTTRWWGSIGTWTVAGPSGVGGARQKPSAARRVVGSWPLRRTGRSVRRRSTGGTAKAARARSVDNRDRAHDVAHLDGLGHLHARGDVPEQVVEGVQAAAAVLDADEEL